MPRGEETQEPIQEEQEASRELKAQDEVKEQEARRDQEVIAEPEAVIERERPVQESEEIELELKEAVEAVDDEGPKREDRGEQAALSAEEVSATPITLPKEDPDGIKAGSDEISATPITLPKEDPDGIKAGSDEVSATPITLPKEDPDGMKTTSEEVSATPITLPKEDGGPKPEDWELTENLDAKSFKVESPSPDRDEDSPKPPQGTMEEGRSEAGEDESPGMEDMVMAEHMDESSFKVESHADLDQEVLDGDSFKPVPADEEGTFSPDEILIEDGEPKPTRPVMEKELPEGGQMEEGFDQHEDLQDLAEGDFSSIMSEGKLTGPDGKESKDSKFGDGLGGMPGMDSGGKIDGSSEDPSGDQFAGKGMFIPGKGPGGGDLADDLEDEADVNAMIEAGATEKELAAKEKQLQEKALDEFELIYTSPSSQPAPAKQKTDSENPPKPKKSDQKSTPGGEEGGGSDMKAVSQEELETVLEETSGDQISSRDPDDQSGGQPDGRLKPEAAKKIKDAMDQAASTKHKQKKAGAELITDPDQEDPEGADLGRKLNMDKDI